MPNITPSPALSYVAGAFLGDGGLIESTAYHYELRFRVRDRDFAEHFSKCVRLIIGKPKDVKTDAKGFFIVRFWSRLLFEFMSDWNSIVDTTERFPAQFIRGFADAEGSPAVSVGRSRKLGLIIVMVNTNRSLLEYVQNLLRDRFAIESHIYLEKKLCRMWSKLPCYHLVIGRRVDQKRFASHIGFLIERKQEKLNVALSLLGNHTPRAAAIGWERLFMKRGRHWTRQDTH